MRHSRFRPVIAVLILTALAGCASGPGGSPLQSAFEQDALPTAAGHDGSELAQAASALQRGDAKTAASLYGQAAARDPGDSAAAMGLGESLLKLGQAAAAVDVYRGLVSTAPTSDAQYGLGRALLASGRPADAVEPLRATQAAAPADAGRATAFGVALDLAGRHAEASAVYRAALASRPGDVTLTSNLGLSLALGGQPTTAIAMLVPLAEGPASTSRIRQNLALAYGLAGDEESARRLASVDLGGDDVRHNLALYAFMRSGDGPVSLAPAAGASPAPLPQRSRAKAEARSPRVAALITEADDRRPRTEKPRPAAAVAAPPPAVVAVAPAAPVAVAPTAAASGLGVASGAAGGWLLDLGPSTTGPEATARWIALRQRHPAAVAGLSRLAAGPTSLVVGLVPDEAEARRRCGMLRAGAPACRPIAL